MLSTLRYRQGVTTRRMKWEVEEKMQARKSGKEATLTIVDFLQE